MAEHYQSETPLPGRSEPAWVHWSQQLNFVGKRGSSFFVTTGADSSTARGDTSPGPSDEVSLVGGVKTGPPQKKPNRNATATHGSGMGQGGIKVEDGDGIGHAIPPVAEVKQKRPRGRPRTRPLPIDTGPKGNGNGQVKPPPSQSPLRDTPNKKRKLGHPSPGRLSPFEGDDSKSPSSTRFRPRRIDVERKMPIIWVDQLEGTSHSNGITTAPPSAECTASEDEKSDAKEPESVRSDQVDIVTPYFAVFSEYDSIIKPRMVRPPTYIRDSLANPWDDPNHVDYEVDSDDEKWMAATPAVGGRKGLTIEKLEKMMDVLEKEAWAQKVDLAKNGVLPPAAGKGCRRGSQKCAAPVPFQSPMMVTPIPPLPPPPKVDPSQAECAVCKGTEEGETTVMECTGCGLKVHATCYFAREAAAPVEDWVCEQCRKGDKSCACVLCGGRGGALKPTRNLKWVHIVCATWVAGVRIGEQVIMGVDSLDRALWEVPCKYCGASGQVTVTCSSPMCGSRFHPVCGMAHGCQILNGRARRSFSQKHCGGVIICGDHRDGAAGASVLPPLLAAPAPTPVAAIRKSAVVEPGGVTYGLPDHCYVCGDGDSEDHNMIVYCDGDCGMCVHQKCYGIKKIPAGRWYCQPCKANVKPKKCVLCPNTFGAYKQTVDGQWCHVACALWIPEVTFRDMTALEPIDGLDKLDRRRFKLRCDVCGKKNAGACIQCAEDGCYVPFHVTCALKEGLPLDVDQALTVAAAYPTYCPKHTKSYERAFKVESTGAEGLVSIDRARTLFKNYSAVVIEAVYMYWAEKRNARGTPLLYKFMMAEASEGMPKHLTGGRKEEQTLGDMRMLRGELETVRTLLNLVCKREKLKRSLALVERQINSHAEGCDP